MKNKEFFDSDNNSRSVQKEFKSKERNREKYVALRLLEIFFASSRPRKVMHEIIVS